MGHLDSLSAFFAMGGYGLFVWASFGISFLSICVMVWLSVLNKKQIFQQVLKEQQRQQRVRKARGESN
jgi:heme exporter protein D